MISAYRRMLGCSEPLLAVCLQAFLSISLRTTSYLIPAPEGRSLGCPTAWKHTGSGSLQDSGLTTLPPFLLEKEKSGGGARLGDGFGITFGSQGDELPNAGFSLPPPTVWSCLLRASLLPCCCGSVPAGPRSQPSNLTSLG